MHTINKVMFEGNTVVIDVNDVHRALARAGLIVWFHTLAYPDVVIRDEQFKDEFPIVDF